MSPKSLMCCKIMAPLMAILLGLVMAFGNPTEARAEGDWTLTSSASVLYQFSADCPGCEQSADLHFIGGMVDIQAEYRFVKWFGLGLDVGLGGMGHRFVSYPTEGWESKGSTDYRHIPYFMALLTVKFIAPLERADLWAELGAGIGIRDFSDHFVLPIVFRLGVTFNLYDNSLGFGFHAGYGAMTWILIFDPSVDLGIHFVKKF
ncbi:MAG: hypothetical protein II767_07060 [Proteobacteria bacterium]|nr:hypothetical protein [Pseudomonadota bacterium]